MVNQIYGIGGGDESGGWRASWRKRNNLCHRWLQTVFLFKQEERTEKEHRNAFFYSQKTKEVLLCAGNEPIIHNAMTTLDQRRNNRHGGNCSCNIQLTWCPSRLRLLPLWCSFCIAMVFCSTSSVISGVSIFQQFQFVLFWTSIATFSPGKAEMVICAGARTSVNKRQFFSEHHGIFSRQIFSTR